jgi:hypothetical protein
MAHKTITCEKCSRELCYGADSAEDRLVNFYVICPCSHENMETFFGYPRLAGTDTYYFDFIDEFKIICKERKFNG